MADDDLYDVQHINFLEELWGEGFLSPGGADEVARVLTGVDLAGKRVLDIGCGSGACAVLLVEAHGADSVVGIDVENPVCTAARDRVARHGLQDRIEIVKVTPGPLPFDADSFDVVFSKDSILHIPDKAVLAADVFRVLRPGGRFAASDWLISHDGDPSPEMAAYIESEALEFAMASPARYGVAMAEAGFADVELVSRNPWYTEVAQQELALLSGSRRADWEGQHGADFIAHQIETWTRMVGVLRSGEHAPHHIRARKPA